MENLQEEKTKNQKSDFADSFLGQLFKYPFGSMSKRDMECLILSSLMSSGLLTSNSLNDVARKLRINESRLKNYLVDIHYKFEEDKHAENLKKIFDGFFAENSKQKSDL